MQLIRDHCHNTYYIKDISLSDIKNPRKQLAGILSFLTHNTGKQTF